jgi:hypothetical protein
MKRILLVAVLAVLACSACRNPLEPTQAVDLKHKPHIQPFDRPQLDV